MLLTLFFGLQGCRCFVNKRVNYRKGFQSSLRHIGISLVYKTPKTSGNPKYKVDNCEKSGAYEI